MNELMNKTQKFIDRAFSLQTIMTWSYVCEDKSMLLLRGHEYVVTVSLQGW
jgi:hypothetical protein